MEFNPLFSENGNHCNICPECGFECQSLDLYFDHLMFDQRHAEIVRRLAEASKNNSNSSSLTTSPVGMGAIRLSAYSPYLSDSSSGYYRL
ncbi:hypothetical protein H4219_003111 [Mycoemilia scoparia]|uniref:Uncharacterized protein n=1 Tax=Mycoemilia scoparia TaxID=417184 RepID=A0A9W8A1H9_9FUNG|nr:hypothetical protein H4219_003111 [Mycoemilia scoparia]